MSVRYWWLKEGANYGPVPIQTPARVEPSL